MRFYKTIGITARKFRKNILLAGSVWGLLQLAVLFATMVSPNWLVPRPSTVDPIRLSGWLLITGIAFLMGYVLIELGKSYKAFLISQFVAYSCLYFIVSVFPSSFSNTSVSYGWLLLVYFAGLPILSSLLGIIGTALGALMGESKTGLRETVLHIDSYQSFFIGALAIILLVSAVTFATGLVSQNNFLSSRNAGLSSDNDRLRSRLSNPVYNYSLTIDRQSKSWTLGTENITLWYTALGAQTGYVRVSWNSSTSVSFHMNILDGSFGTPGGVSGSYRVPVIQPVHVEDFSWFHNDRCPTTCPAGNLNYSIVNWYQ